MEYDQEDLNQLIEYFVADYITWYASYYPQENDNQEHPLIWKSMTYLRDNITPDLANKNPNYVSIGDLKKYLETKTTSSHDLKRWSEHAKLLSIDRIIKQIHIMLKNELERGSVYYMKGKYYTNKKVFTDYIHLYLPSFINLNKEEFLDLFH